MRKLFAIFVLLVLLNAGFAYAQPLAFTFAAFGDNRPAQATASQPARFRELLARMKIASPDFAVNTGDCVYGSSSMDRLRLQYKDYTDAVASLFGGKVYLAVGNHEAFSAKASQGFFQKELGSLYYSFDKGDSHFIVLDSDVVGEEGKITGEQMVWLKDDLYKARAARHKFVFLHRPLYPVGGHTGSSMDASRQDRDALHGLFARNRITAVFSGHEHLFDAQKRNGVIYIITGGGGAEMYPSFSGGGDFPHFVQVKVAGDKVDMTVVKMPYRGKPEQMLPVSSFIHE